MKAAQSTDNRERVLLVGVGRKRAPRVPGGETGQVERDALVELAELTESAGGNVVGSMLQLRDRPDPATLVGRGKLEEIEAEAQFRKANLVIFDASLTPSQQRNIDDVLDRRVIDRTQLILDIFAKHARSREGQLQVELAQLNYLLPRLAGSRTELSRLGGGIGTRGPGEQKIETDRRRIRDRIQRLQQNIETVRRQRSQRRASRQAVPLGTVALVGYTNAGKSTLFNALTKAKVVVSSRMFATLDPTVRAVRMPSGRRVLLSDTVGFIRALPPALIAAFRATLEEVQEAALLLHVTDAANPQHAEQDQEVEKVLADLGVEKTPRLRVYNKVDLLPPEELAALRLANGSNAYVSAATGDGLDNLLARIDAGMPIDPVVRLKLRVPLADGKSLALIYALGRVVNSVTGESEMRLDVELPESLARRVAQYAAKPAKHAG
ncbi:MAG TPA: GTPase HflX [Candidatus Acidoferrales bacterium]|nr:GTPase HflX [Candidatus Acidoferrales bacterium]